MTYRRMEILLSPTLDDFLMSTMEKALIKLLAWKLSYRFHNVILIAPTNWHHQKDTHIFQNIAHIGQLTQIVQQYWCMSNALAALRIV